MEPTIYLGFVIFLFMLAIFDLLVGVSNDAVNFLNSAVGSKTASFRTIIIIAAIGVFLGASMSNGMMEIARHGIVLPEHYYFEEIMCIFLAVMVTDVILLDIFNSLGMPTSTTVSMVFELLGAAFAISIIKMANAPAHDLGMSDLLNTDKALQVIVAIFVSVAVAFVFGAIVQYLSRLFFTFNYKRNLKWKIGIFGGLAATAIIYFMLIKGVKDLTFMTPDNKQWVHDNTAMIVIGCFVFFSVLMQILYFCKVNVLKVIVLMGTFALAMAFAGNDLVNFIGVPLAGFDSYKMYIESGLQPDQLTMGALNGPARTPTFFLIIAGAVMVYALATSKKARKVIKTSVDLSKQDGGDEMFGSSKVARSLVRNTTNVVNGFLTIVPQPVKTWCDKRFNKDEVILENGAAFDQIRAAVNLVLAGLLIALGTSLKLPLSTTYVTFMVAMGTSLADRAWGRESAVFRITGVISVIGGWFITAGAAFIMCGLVATIMYYGGVPMSVIMVLLAIVLLVRSNIRFRKKSKVAVEDDLFVKMMSTTDKAEVWKLLKQFNTEEEISTLKFVSEAYTLATDGFVKEELRSLRKADLQIREKKRLLKKSRRKEIVALRNTAPATAIEKSTWMHLCMNCCMELNYCLRRICEPCEEHIDNNFTPLPQECVKEFIPMRDNVVFMLGRAAEIIQKGDFTDISDIRNECSRLKESLSMLRKKQISRLNDDNYNITVSYVYITVIQESEEMISQIRHMLRASDKFNGE